MVTAVGQIVGTALIVLAMDKDAILPAVTKATRQKVPVVAYDPRGERGLRWYRKRQKGLLGEAVSVVIA